MSYSAEFIKEGNESSDILQRIAREEKSAVSDCLAAYGKLVWGLARKFTKTREDAEDAVQEIFIDIWKYAARFDATKSPEGAFVTLIARRRLIDRLRKTNLQLPVMRYESDLLNQASDADKKLQMYMEMKFAVDALDKMNVPQKQILQMAVYGGMSHSEIAEATGLPLGTVKSQIRRGFQKLRDTIGVSDHF
ncbi:MAG: sigma-70 family RNA polymerase sigma factor [Acidobacteriota bacterium]|nr:sigma-70 family RNA polymerase sigma factor [Acidobacteriota bacterium]